MLSENDAPWIHPPYGEALLATPVTYKGRKMVEEDVVYSTGEHVRELSCSECGCLVAVIPVDAPIASAESQVLGTACECA